MTIIFKTSKVCALIACLLFLGCSKNVDNVGESAQPGNAQEVGVSNTGNSIASEGAGEIEAKDQIVQFPDPKIEVSVRQALGKPKGDITHADIKPMVDHFLNYFSKTLMDKDPKLRRTAALTIASGKQSGNPIYDFEPEAALPPLIKALEDEDPEVRGNVAMALKVFGPEAKGAVPSMIEALKREFEKWGEGSSGVIPPPHLSIIMAFQAIGEEEAQLALPVLTEALTSENDRIREAAAQAFQFIGPAGADGIPKLQEALEDKSDAVVRAASRSLGKLGDPSVPSLKKTR